MKRFLSFFVFITFLFYSSTCFASPFAIQVPETIEKPKISSIQKGDVAPFTGVLFNETAASELIVEKSTAEEKCKIETKKAVDTEKAKLNLKLENEKAARMAAERRANEIGAMKDKQIEFLENQAIKSNKKSANKTGWLVGGIIGGVLIGVVGTVAGTYALSELRR